MSGILEKARLITLGNLHDLLDKAIDMNSPSMIRQQVRDLEDAEQKMGAAKAEQAGALRTMQREKGDLETKVANLKSEIKSLIASDPNSTVARSKGALAVQLQGQIDSRATGIESQQKIVDSMAVGLQRVDAQHTLLVARLRELERLDRETKAKTAAADALRKFNSVSGSVNSVDDVEDRMRRKNDQASASFDDALANTPAPPETNSADVDALLASLKG